MKPNKKLERWLKKQNKEKHKAAQFLPQLQKRNKPCGMWHGPDYFKYF